MVSQIGAPVTSPTVMQVKLAARHGFPIAKLKQDVDDVTAHYLGEVPKLIDDFIEGAIDLF